MVREKPRAMVRDMIREKELRLALVCYGGVSLAVYMHGITKELWKLLRASEARKGRHPVSGDSEPIWRELLHGVSGSVDLVVLADVLAGASAGGLNAILLSNALTLGQSLEPLTDMWLDKADVDNLLDPDARPKTALSARLARFYKEPVAWLAARYSSDLASVDVPEVRAEVTLKLAHFVRSRWFQPPFSGAVLTGMVDDAMEAMEQAGPIGPPLVPPSLALSLFVTATDYWGVKTELPIHSPPVVSETEHRRLFSFESPPQTQPLAADQNGDPCVLPPRQPVAERPALLLAARATASFPGAFPPASIGEIDARLQQTGRQWPERSRFVASQLAGDRPPEDVALIDGSVLDNAPFGPAIEAIKRRPSHREVDRRFVYIDPKPGIDEGPLGVLDHRPPGFLTTILRSLVDIPRAQPIRDSLDLIASLSARLQRLRTIIEAMLNDVDAAILRVVGTRFFLLPMTPERLARARSGIQSEAAREAGFAFGAYAQLKLQIVLDDAVGILARSLKLEAGALPELRQRLVAAARRRGAFRHDAAVNGGAAGSGYVQFLRGLDVGFRVRRLRFFIRRLASEPALSASEREREEGDALKAALYQIIAPFEARRLHLSPGDCPALRQTVEELLAAEGPAAIEALGGRLIDGLAQSLGLSVLDSEADQLLMRAARNPAFSRPAQRALVRAWLGYPFFDIAILPLIGNEGLEGLEDLKVDRISPDDANSLAAGGAAEALKGWQLNAFAAFFSRAYRENDYLWGRLHAAERLVDIVRSAVPEAEIDERRWKARLFGAILDAEEPHLSHVPVLIAELRQRLQQFEAGEENAERPRPDLL